MSHQLRRLLAPAAIVAAVLSPPVQASTTLDFEDPTLFPLYFDGESFSEDGFTMFVSGDAGLVDDGIGLGTAAPSGSSGYYYTQANDGWLTIARNNGGAFSLDGFSAAFVPLNPPSALATAIRPQFRTASRG